MSKVVVLGGSGGIGQVAVRALAAGRYFDELVVADVREDAARAVAADVGAPGVSARRVDALSPEDLHGAIAGATVVLNCVGPFYKFGPPILGAAIAARVDYVDVCDDLDPTVKMLALDAEAKAAGISALVGMGNSPGLANVFVRLCADMLLDQVLEVDIMHIHGGEPEEGPAVVKHRIHAMVNDVPLFVDGAFVQVRQLEESGRAFVRDVEFRGVGTYPVYPYPHPETITLPENLPGLRRATNLGVIFPLPYFELTQEMVRVGACTTDALTVEGAPVVPLEFSVAHILSRRASLLAASNVAGPAGCLRVDVSGTRRGERRTIVFQLSSRSAGAGEGTGIPAAVGAVLMARKEITRKGVFAPEAGVPPVPVLLTAMEMAGKLGVGGGDSIHVEMIDAAGNRSQIPLSMIGGAPVVTSARPEGSLFLGHDAGTGGVKSVLATADGRVVASASASYPLDRGGHGHAEQDPAAWWRAVGETTRALLRDAGAAPSQVAAIGFAGQMLSLVPVDAGGAPTRPAISWLDARAGAEARRMVRRMGGERVVVALAGASPTGKDLVAKVAWLRAHEPAVFARTAAFLDATGYLVAQATGQLVADPTAAGATGLYEKMGYSRLLAWLCKYPLDRAPRIVRSADVVGPLTSAAAAHLGLAAGTPVVAGLSDIPAAAVGSGALSDGDAHLYLGTSSWIGMTSRRPLAVAAHGIASVPGPDGALHLAIGESETAGACVDWAVRELAPDLAGPALDALVAGSVPGAHGLLFCPWMYGERTPVPDATLRGAFVHLSLEHRREDMARGVYEGIAQNLAWIVEAFARARPVGPALRAIGGGAQSDVWMQIVADVTERRIDRVAHAREAGALGAALVAAVGAGAIRDVASIARVVQVERTFTPRPALAPRYRAMRAAMKALQPALSEASRALAETR